MSLLLRSRAIAVRNQRRYQPRSACNYKQYKVGRSLSNSGSQFRFIPITQGPWIITVGHMWTLKKNGELIESCRMYLSKKKLKPMGMASIESVRKVVRFCDVRRSLGWTCGGEKCTYIPTEYIVGSLKDSRNFLVLNSQLIMSGYRIPWREYPPFDKAKIWNTVQIMVSGQNG